MWNCQKTAVIKLKLSQPEALKLNQYIYFMKLEYDDVYARWVFPQLNRYSLEYSCEIMQENDQQILGRNRE